MIGKLNKETCDKCTEPLDRYLNCGVCKDCKHPDIVRLKALLKKLNWLVEA